MGVAVRLADLRRRAVAYRVMAKVMSVSSTLRYMAQYHRYAF